MRRRKPKKRIILPDPKFNNVQVTKFVNNLMLQGKKNLAFTIFYDAMDIIQEKTGEEGLPIWEKALANITPAVEVRSRRVGGATFQIPQPIRDSRKESMGMKWLISFASRKRNGKSMGEKISRMKLSQQSKEEGAAYKKERRHAPYG